MKGAQLKDLTLSRSQILEYLNCRYRWDAGYRRGIQTTKVQEKLDLGTAVHEGIRVAVGAYASKKAKKLEQFITAAIAGIMDWQADMVQDRKQYNLLTDEMGIQIKALRDEAVIIARRALEHFDLPSWEVAQWQGKPLYEREMLVPLPPWKGYRVIPDLVACEVGQKRHGYWIIDWKTRGQFESDDAEEINLQFSTIQKVMADVAPDIKVEGSLLWQIKSAAPKWPTLNKDGSMSRALIASDWPTYEKALREAGLDPKQSNGKNTYESEMRPKLSQIEWWHVIKQHRTVDECDRIWEQIVEPVAAEMAKNPTIIRRFVHQPFGCSGCWLRAFCLSELRGDDTDFLLQTDYVDTHNPRTPIETGEPKRKFTLT